MSIDDVVLAYQEKIKNVGVDAEEGANLHICCNAIDRILAEASDFTSDEAKVRAAEILNKLFSKLLWDSRTGNRPYRHMMCYSIEHIKLKLEEMNT